MYDFDIDNLPRQMGSIIKQEREAIIKNGKKITQTDLGEMIGEILGARKSHKSGEYEEYVDVDYKTIGKWESGKTLPNLDRTIALCKIFNCDIDYLIGDSKLRHQSAAEIMTSTGLTSEAADELISSMGKDSIHILSKLIEKGLLNLLDSVAKEQEWHKKSLRFMNSLSYHTREWLIRVVDKASLTICYSNAEATANFFNTAHSFVDKLSNERLAELNNGFPNDESNPFTEEEYDALGLRPDDITPYSELYAPLYFDYAPNYADRSLSNNPDRVSMFEFMPKVYFYGHDYYDYKRGHIQRSLVIQQKIYELIQ